MSFDDLASAADAFDRLAFSPARLGERAVLRFQRQRRRRAAADPGWAAIEARRETGRSAKILLSSDLTLADWDTQRRIAERLTPDPWWLPFARQLSGARLGGPVAKLGWAAQRARRGWADRDLWSLGHVACSRLGAQLAALAEQGHGWPESDEFPTPDDWQSALQVHAGALVRYGTGGADRELTAALHDWYELAVRHDVPGETLEAAKVRLDTLEASILDDAKAALHWVGDHLEQLWD